MESGGVTSISLIQYWGGGGRKEISYLSFDFYFMRQHEQQSDVRQIACWRLQNMQNQLHAAESFLRS
jgi:hypothetical protein